MNVRNQIIPFMIYAAIGERQYLLLNQKQKEVIDTVLQIIFNDNFTNVTNGTTLNNCIHINGIGGSRKTFIYSTLYYLLKAKNVQMQSITYTGIAAILLPKSKTVHKTFHLPVPVHADST